MQKTSSELHPQASTLRGLIPWLWLLAMAWATPGIAGVVMDQYIVGWHADEPLAVGGGSEQMLAQTYESGRDGTLDHVKIVLGCSAGSSGLVTVEVRSVRGDGTPSDTVLGATSLSAATFPVEAMLQEIPMPAVRIHSGTEYALVIRGTRDLACATRPGAGPWLHSSGVGPAFFDARPNPPGWAPYINHGIDGYVMFQAWVDTGGPSSPRYCDFETADGMPNNWLPNDVPLCGCARDPGLVAHRCWFATPDFVLWRTLAPTFDRPRVRAEWSLVPMTEDLPAITIKEYDPDGPFASGEIHFKPGSKPGRPTRQKAFYTGSARQSEVLILIDGQPEPTTIIFETLLDIPYKQ